MFTAFDKVAHTQFALYADYADQAISSTTARLAEDILNAGWTVDAELKAVNENLRSFAGDDKIYPCEYTLFAIRSADGIGWDVYFLDEDRLFLSAVAGIDIADLAPKALDIAANWRDLTPGV